MGVLALGLSAACSSPSEGGGGTGAATTSTNATLPGEAPEAGAPGVELALNDGGPGVMIDAGPGVAVVTDAGAFNGDPSSSADGSTGATDTARPAALGAVDAATRAVPLDSSTSGHVVYRLGSGWNAIAGSAGATPTAISGALDAISPGSDSFVNLSSDGAFLALDTNRFGCGGDCLGFATSTSSMAGLVGTQAANARPAIAAGGNLMVVPQSGGPHSLDLYAIKRDSSSSAWGAPVLLTGASSAAFHHDPSISWDGSRVTFDCGPTPYQANASDICDVALDGTGFRVVTTADGGPGGSTNNETHHPGYAPDGTIVFEADWGGSERIWRIGAASAPTTPVLITPPGMTDDNSPCVLPDGRIASLWLGRVGNPQGLHELKVMQADGTGSTMLVENVDVVDVGLACGK